MVRTISICLALALGVGVVECAHAAAGLFAQEKTWPAFEVVSVKPCASDAVGASRVGGSPATSPGRLFLNCYSVMTMIREAYLYFADGRARETWTIRHVEIEGGPEWLTSERFAIEARGNPTAPAAVMRGPMLQAVLEDRFKLKLRREKREMPAYELVVAKSGAKLTPYTGNECVMKDHAAWPPVVLPEGQRYCGDSTTMDGASVIRTGVATLDTLAGLFAFDRPVINKTGIAGPVRYRLEITRTDFVIGPPTDSMLSALRTQLGLELRSAKAPREYLVIEHVERPGPNLRSKP